MKRDQAKLGEKGFQTKIQPCHSVKFGNNDFNPLTWSYNEYVKSEFSLLVLCERSQFSEIYELLGIEVFSDALLS
jgi:hypothetical protein